MKILSVVGARPNFMKIAPLIAAVNRCNAEAYPQSGGNGRPSLIEHRLVHTGQHYDKMMSDAFFTDLNLPEPDICLGVGSGSHAAQVADIMKQFEGVLLEEKPDVLIVVGDVNSTIACALTASKVSYDGNGRRPLIAHVEAGLRSFDRTMPEEINRIVTDAVADILFTPSEDADANLLREGISPGKIIRVGNVMIDTLAAHLDTILKRTVWNDYGLRHEQYAFVTLHRPGNVDTESSLSGILNCLDRISDSLNIIFPVHPRTRKKMEQFNLLQRALNIRGLRLTEPLSYFDTIGLVAGSRFVLTDSGGLQEETTFLKVPCLTLRANTERPVTISRGTNKLTSVTTLLQDVAHILECNARPAAIPELWDGASGERIIRALIKGGVPSEAAANLTVLQP